jgi:hypothetical protein
VESKALDVTVLAVLGELCKDLGDALLLLLLLLALFHSRLLAATGSR